MRGADLTSSPKAGIGRWRSLVLALTMSLACCAALATNARAWPVYVDVNEANRVEVIDSATNRLTGSSFETARIPQRLAITPDGSQLYLAHTGSNFVTTIETASGHEVGEPIPVGQAPLGIAITPDGRFAYVADNNSGQVSVIDTATRRVVKTIGGFENPPDVAISPDGSHAYVADAAAGTVTVIEIGTNRVVGSPIEVGGDPSALAFTPDGHYLFVVGAHGGVAVIDIALGIVVGSAIPVGELPQGIAITPDGSTAYVTNFGSNDVTVIDTATKQVKKTIDVGHLPDGVAVTPDGRFAYVANDGVGEAVSVIDTAKNEVATTVLGVGNYPEDVVVAPDQPPQANFTASPALVRPGEPVSFNSTGSVDPDGTIGSYTWKFGDDSGASGPVQSHAFAAPGTYPVILTEADTLGCSAEQVYTGHEPYCNGGPGAIHVQNVSVSYPKVKVACPKRALEKPGCTVKLAAVARKGGKAKGGKHKRRPRLSFETAIAKAKLKPGASASVAIVPKPFSAAALDSASSTLVREVLDFKTKSGHQHQVKLAKKPVF